ncbi:hypothetical protein O7621_24195 [Solwaraspora sp. WMMD937]|uniref:hypothetical protein n=1 Tax=Solwaraspora sp. WMMD937 TaxID=3016090 RepID=UPI002499ED0F|nr:hypothetical protein [Solwaraspora sp. WMMD937]WFE20937.1 hypothetical protein O7621_24195 [Solwaraspora sp. WMMD937]
MLELLQKPDDDMSPAPVTLTTALLEMEAWASDERSYEHHNHATGWETCYAALKWAHKNCGPKLVALIRDEFQAVEHAFPQNESQRKDKGIRSKFAAALHDVIQITKSGRGREQAFMDFVSSTRQAASSRRMLYTRDTLLDLLDMAEWSRRETAMQLTGILGGDRWHVDRALETLKPSRPEEAESTQASESGGPSYDQPTRLAATFLMADQPRGVNIIWLAYDRTVIRGNWIPTPEIQIFPADWLIPNLTSIGSANRASVPSELREAYDLVRQPPFAS